MLLSSPHLFFVVAALFLLYLTPASSFEMVEKDDIYRLVPCPAFLVFDTAAYLSDMTFELPCRCKPEQINSVVWYYKKNLANDFTQVLTDFNGTTQVDSEDIRSGYDLLLRFSIRMFSLIVFRAQKEDSGHYICGTREGQYFYGYSVDIQESQKAYIAFEDQNGHPQQDLVMKDFVSFTAFWHWTVCDRCDVRGEQRRLGLCYIKSVYLNLRYRVTQDDVASCGSDAVPARFKKLISGRRPEIIIRSCMSPCNKPKKGILGKVYNIMNSVIKLKDRIPWFPKVPTQMHTHSLGSSLIIGCPGAKPEHAVAWDKGNQRLYRTEYLIGKNNSMRVYIDHGNHLNFRFIQRNDKGVYYCWLQGKMKAGFRLAVQTDTGRKRTFTDAESIFAMKVIGMSYLFFTIIFLFIQCGKCCSYNFRCLPLI
ncbi:Ig-like V-type domain-containing protein FAM187A [Mixophyes fleayi]|uniref:Ig-like V-type domain-containing protein FAM187A n=1 Tax=Mixophyes fleayi TaxID=3061075 RepID=UPI003F4DD428